MTVTDTICAIATPPGVGGVGVIRISGPLVPEIAKALLNETPRPRYAHFSSFLDKDGSVLDTGLALFFPGPHSFTGEDVLEIQGHGGPVIMNLLLQRILSLGVRLARPGEFSERAFLNDKLDLAQAEAIADLIESGTEAAAKAAQRSLQGVFSQQVNDLLQAMIELRVFVEAAIDFPDEEIDFLAESDVLQRLQKVEQRVEDLMEQAHQGQLLRDGITLAIIGRPNAGKSSLLNALSAKDVAIVTDVPGTTRDILREQISLDGLPVHLADTAGIRETGDQVEAEGVRRARAALQSADLALLVLDLTQDLESQLELQQELPDKLPCIYVYNKVDRWKDSEKNQGDGVYISAKQGQGLDTLKQTIKDRLGVAEQTEGTFSARSRHMDALKRVGEHLGEGRRQLETYAAGELLAEELRQAQHALSEITGDYVADDLLGAIFSSFCIGK